MEKAKRATVTAPSKDCPILLANWKQLSPIVVAANKTAADLMTKLRTLENEMRAKGCPIPRTAKSRKCGVCE